MMYIKIFFIIISLSLSFGSIFACDFVIKNNQSYFTDGIIDKKIVKPGDRICIEDGKRGYIKFIGFHGDKNNPIIISNYGGLVDIESNHTYGLALGDSSFIHIDGSQDDDLKYGIKVKAPKAGHVVSLEGGSSDIEISNIEIYGDTYTDSYSALGAKTDPKCGSDFVRGKFEMKNILIHDNYIHDINQGLYVGWTFFTREISCEGNKIMGHTVQGVKIYNNIFKRIGQDGLQVSSATSTQGKCQIYGNYFEDISLRNKTNQKSFITIGGGSKCDVYDNIMIDGYGPGVLFLGYEGNIYNNFIWNAGKKSDNVDGIFVDHRSGKELEGSRVNIYSNTIINPARNGIRFYNKYLIDNTISDNLIINPGFNANKNHWARKENGQYIYLEKGRIDRKQINNGAPLSEYLTVSDIEKIDNSQNYDNLGLKNYDGDFQNISNDKKYGVSNFLGNLHKKEDIESLIKNLLKNSDIKHRGIWFRGNSRTPQRLVDAFENQQKMKSIISDFGKYNMDRAYLCFDSLTVTDPTTVSRRNTSLHKAGIQSELLIGDDFYLVIKNKSKFFDKIQDYFINYNETQDSKAQFDAIHFDLEPQAGSIWDNSSLKQKKEYLYDLLSIYKETRKYLDKNGMNEKEINVDLPHWLSNIDSLGWEDEQEMYTWFRDVSKYVDKVTLMTYETKNIATLAKWAKEEKDIFGNKLNLALDFETFDSINELFSMAALIEKELDFEVDIHHYGDLR